MLALATCCHCPLLATDHLGETIKKHGKGSTLQNIRLHRTKCTSLISSVLLPSIKSYLKSDISGKKILILVDERTDVSAEKILAICFQYFSECSGKVVAVFLGLYPVCRQLVRYSFKLLNRAWLSLSGCIGLGCDGAAVMVG